MKKIRTLLIFFMIFLFYCSCKKIHKDYNCVCANAGGVVRIYQMNESQDSAIIKCSNYSKEFQTSANKTKCRLQ